MTPSDRFETLIAGWLSTEALARAPRGTLDAALDRTRSVRPLAGWRARILVPPMRRDSTILVGAPLARRAAVAAAVALLAVTAMLLVAGALVLRSQLSKMDLFVYVANPISLPTAFCAEVHDCRNGLSGWPGGRFVLVQESGAEPRVLVEAPWPSTIFDLRVAPDGMRLAYARTQVGFPGTCRQLVTLDLTTGEETVVAEMAGGWDWAVASTTGGRERLIFSAAGRCSPGGAGVFAYDLEDGSTTTLFDVVNELGVITESRFGFTWVSVLAVDPDGRRVLVSVHRTWEQPSDTYIIAVDGALPPRPVACECSGVGGAWSTDGALMIVEAGSGTLLAGSSDGSSFRRLATLAESPAWSPDGTLVAYLGPAPDSGDRRYNRGIYVVDAVGGEPVQIAGVRLPNSTITTPPRWSPSGAWIYWSDIDATWAIRPDGTDLRQMVLPGQVDLNWVAVEAR